MGEYGNTTTAYADGTIWDGTVGSGTQLLNERHWIDTAARTRGTTDSVVVTPTSASKTYNIGLNQEGGGTASFMTTTLGYACVELL